MGFDFLLLIGGIVAFAAATRRIARLERTVEHLEYRLAADRVPAQPTQPAPEAETADAIIRAVALEPRRTARVVRSAPVEPPDRAQPERPEQPEPSAPEPARQTFEALVAGKLPIWIGGAALVIAGFFLVRYSIESGLLGPAVRVALAAAFSAALIAGSEVARRLPLTRDDPRVGQVLAGAGTASAYGTLYVAVAQYALVGAAAGFVLMLAITALALFLALRHGPPTAIMALIGGFAAPLIAGFDAAGLGPLLGYLALFIAALFGLAARRGWTWLALAAVVAGFGWANLLVVLLDGRDTAGVAAFVVALAIGATLALPRTGAATGWLRAAPMVAGLVQLLVLAPTLDFGATAWSFHLVLAAAALILAGRDPRLLPAALAAAPLVVVLIALALLSPEWSGEQRLLDPTATHVAALVATLLFGGAGLALSRRVPAWASIALIGLAGPVLTAHLCRSDLLGKPAWAVLELLAAASAAALAWRHRDRIASRDIGLVAGTAVAALLASVALATVAGPAWAPLALIPVLLPLGGWGARVNDDDVARLPALLLVALFLLTAEPLLALIKLLSYSLSGVQLTYPMLPPIAQVLRMIAAPAAAAAALLALPRAYGTLRRPVAIALGITATAIAYALLKQPLAIATDARFTAFGFAERAAITLAFLVAGWALAKRTRFMATGQALAAVAVARFVWFDLLLLNPVSVAQQVGTLPLANLAVLLPAAIAVLCFTLAATRPWRIVALLATAAAVAAAVRQIAHGTILTGEVGTGETWGYSAMFLLLAVAWLWRGLMTGARDLRVAGLAVLTLVTLKVFLIDVAALGGVLRILSFLGLGLALIGIGWAYGRIVARTPAAT